MSDRYAQERPDFVAPPLPAQVVPTPYRPAPPSQAAVEEPVRPRLTAKTGAALVTGLLVIALVGVVVAVWATSPRPQSAMPAAWTATGSSAPAEPTAHLTVPVATGNRATTTPAQTTARVTTTGTSKVNASGSPKPTATSTMRLPTCSPGQTVVTAAWTATIPAGWSCPDSATGDGSTQLVIFDPEGDVIVVAVVDDAPDAVTACSLGLAGQEGVNSGPDSSWGGRPATNVSLQFEAVVLARCVESKGSVYMMLGEGVYETPAQTLQVMDALSAAWVWS